MLSAFLKKLLFARQFCINDGKIQILGMEQTMIPISILAHLEDVNPKKAHSIIQKDMQNILKDYAKKLGSSSLGMIGVMQNIFETFGFGKLQIIHIDNDKKSAILNILDSPLSKLDSYNIVSATLEGMFGFIFNSPVKVSVQKRTKDYCLIHVKGGKK